MNRLGIIDWGIGGVSIYKLIKERIGDVSVTYFSDTGMTPYGKMTRSELVSRLNAVIQFLKDRGVTHLVIGCNAASTALSFLDDHGIKIEGIIDSAVEATVRLKPMRLGLIGGRRTVLSGVYRRAFAERGIIVRQRIAQPLSGLIESGDIGSESLRHEVRRILNPLTNCSHILLACTHYPAITPVLRQFLSPTKHLIDPAGELVSKFAGWRLSKVGCDEFLTSGDAKQMRASTKQAFGVLIKKASTVRF
jgi:glutamate racemase